MSRGEARQMKRAELLAHIDNTLTYLTRAKTEALLALWHAMHTEWTSDTHERKLTMAAALRLADSIRGSLRACEDPQFDEVDGVL